MKWFQYIFMAVVFVSLSYSCRSVKFIPVTESIDLSEYKAYVFRLCEYRKSYGNTRFFLCDKPCEVTDVQADADIQVIEELYVLRSTINPENIIYITSKSDKYIQRNRGIFNDTLYQKYIMASDFEYVYFGKMTNTDKMKFINANEALSFYLRSDPENCRFVIDSIYSQTTAKNSISNKHLKIFNSLMIEIQFLETDRKIVIGKNDRDTIKTLVLKEGRMYFNGSNKRINLSQRNRLKYHPIYGPTNDSIVKRIITDSIQKQGVLKAKAL